MDYTKNFHLPQWVRSDRILMEDFNEAMANIENGLAKIETNASSSSAACSLAQAQAWDALLRFGRNDLKNLLDQLGRDSIYSRNGLLFNPLASAEMARTMTGTQWHEHLGVYAGRGEFLPDDILLSCCNVCRTGNNGLSHLSYHDSYYEFTAPLTGTIKRFNLYFCSDFTANSQNLTLDLTLTATQLNGSGAGVKLTKNLYMERTGRGVTEENLLVDIDLPIVEGVKYRLHLVHNKQPEVMGEFGFMTASVNPQMPNCPPYTQFWVLEPPITSASHTRTFPSEGAASHAVAVLRYRKAEAASSISAALGGKALSKISEETVTAPDGQPCRELWLSGEGSYLGNTQIKISLNSTATDNLQLLEYAVMLL